jgi:hypothetical protein
VRPIHRKQGGAVSTCGLAHRTATMRRAMTADARPGGEGCHGWLEPLTRSQGKPEGMNGRYHEATPARLRGPGSSRGGHTRGGRGGRPQRGIVGNPGVPTIKSARLETAAPQGRDAVATTRPACAGRWIDQPALTRPLLAIRLTEPNWRLRLSLPVRNRQTRRSDLMKSRSKRTFSV